MYWSLFMGLKIRRKSTIGLPDEALETAKGKLSCLAHPQKPRPLAFADHAAELGC
jgi:hypothetical protein